MKVLQTSLRLRAIFCRAAKMEAIAAFGLACNVIQVISFGLQAADVCKQIYSKGSADGVSEVTITAHHLEELSQCLQKSINGAAHAKPLTKEDSQLLDIAIKCSETAAKLRAELAVITMQGTPSRMAAFKKAYQTVRRKRTLEELHKRLQDYERSLNTQLLAQLKYVF